jgi:hypothetical protein
MLNVVMQNDNMLSVVMQDVFMLILQRVIMQNDVILCVIMQNVIMLNVISSVSLSWAS